MLRNQNEFDDLEKIFTKRKVSLDDIPRRRQDKSSSPKSFKIRVFSYIPLTLLASLFLYLILLWISLQGKVSKIINYKPILATQIFDSKDRLVANIFNDQFRLYSKFHEIPPKLIEGLLAIEDTLFFEHHGLNYDAILRAGLKNLYHSKYAEGGSTLTQQLVKNLVLTRDKTLLRKIKEAMISLQIEFILTKEQILERYLNDTFFGHGYYGIKAASEGYFKKNLNQLTLKEIAILVSLPRAPSYYDPTKNIHIVLARANSVLERMLKLGWVGEGEYSRSIKEVPIVYDQTLNQNKAPYVVDALIKELNFIKDLKSGGYTIKLNIDLDYQNIAQKAIKEGLEKVKTQNSAQVTLLDSKLNGAMVVTDVRTGNILALVGGADYSKSAFNRATQARRQIGSIIKPFIYQNAFDNGYSTATLIPDVARSFGKDDDFYRPKNVGNVFNGLVRLRYALIHSLNLATLNLVDKVGFDSTADALKSYGFDFQTRDMTIVLGSFSQSPLQVAREYSMFSNDGVIVEPNLIKSISQNDKIIQEFLIKETAITTPTQVYLTKELLQDVVKYGTGRRAQVKGLQIAGKTGTTNNNQDAWFVGFSPDVQVVLWAGNDDNSTIGKHGGGTSVVAPIFADFMSQILKLHPEMKRKFKKPDGVYSKDINGVKYFYTDISKLPGADVVSDKLIF